MGLMDFISGGLTTATNAATAQQQGKMQGSQLAMAIAMRQAQMEKERAETAQALAHSKVLMHQNQAPVLGELDENGNDRYATAEGAVAGAKARAEVQPHIDQAVGTAQGEAPIKVKMAGDIENAQVPGKVAAASGISNATLGNDLLKIQKRVEAQSLGARLQETIGKDFVRQNQDLAASARPYAVAKAAIAEARRGNPAALKSALLDYAAVADPKMQLRQGIMHEAMQVDPSIQGKWDMLVDRLASGQLPPRILDDMEKMMDAVHAANRGLFDQRRQAFLSRQPLAQQFIPTTEETFDLPGSSGGSGGGSAAPAPRGNVRAKYGLPPTQ